ncbi:hypothetical protein BZA77DRAFT_354686 [Pyronema omphalodes]|nr:hypothetical protein BZA77DRAFT_354686 [Pyronema omphalodes]
MASSSSKSSKTEQLAKELSDLKESLRNSIAEDKRRAASEAGLRPDRHVRDHRRSRGELSSTSATGDITPRDQRHERNLLAGMPANSHKRLQDCLVEYKAAWAKFDTLGVEIKTYRHDIATLSKEISRLYEKRDSCIFAHFDMSTLTPRQKLEIEAEARAGIIQQDGQKKHYPKLKDEITLLIRKIERMEDDEYAMIDHVDRLRNAQILLRDDITVLEAKKEELVSEYFEPGESTPKLKPKPKPKSNAKGKEPEPKPKSTAKGKEPEPKPKSTAKGKEPDLETKSTAKGKEPEK